jgi:hypothetical protein
MLGLKVTETWQELKESYFDFLPVIMGYPRPAEL